MPTSPIQNTFGKRAPDGAWEIPILGDIGFFGVNGADLIRELQAVKPTQVRFTIFSPGGAVYDAIAVVGYMLDKGIESYTEIYGVCASAATVFAAHSGPKNTAIAPGSMFLVHMPFGGDQKAIDNAVDFLLNLYTKSYGWTKAEAKAHLEAADGEGIFWTAAEAKKLGVCSEIMEGAKVAARLQLNTTAMAETKPTIKVKTKVHLSTLEAVRAAMATDGTEIELEVAQEQVATDALTASQSRVAELEAENAQLKADKEKAVEVAQAEAVTNANKEAAQAKADLDTANAAHTKALADKEAAHVLAIAELTKPLASRTVANNQEAGVGAVPGVEKVDPNIAALRREMSTVSSTAKVVANANKATA
jgi:ATP-dependent protease ClpP protease subunit